MGEAGSGPLGALAHRSTPLCRYAEPSRAPLFRRAETRSANAQKGTINVGMRNISQAGVDMSLSVRAPERSAQTCRGWSGQHGHWLASCRLHSVWRCSTAASSALRVTGEGEPGRLCAGAARIISADAEVRDVGGGRSWPRKLASLRDRLDTASRLTLGGAWTFEFSAVSRCNCPRALCTWGRQSSGRSSPCSYFSRVNWCRWTISSTSCGLIAHHDQRLRMC